MRALADAFEKTSQKHFALCETNTSKQENFFSALSGRSLQGSFFGLFGKKTDGRRAKPFETRGGKRIFSRGGCPRVRGSSWGYGCPQGRAGGTVVHRLGYPRLLTEACGGAAARENPYRAAKSADKKAGRSPETGKFCGGQPRK